MSAMNNFHALTVRDENDVDDTDAGAPGTIPTALLVVSTDGYETHTETFDTRADAEWYADEIRPGAHEVKVIEQHPTTEEQRLEYLRSQLRAECMNYDELNELESLIPYISTGDTELLQAAGVPEFPEPTDYRYRLICQNASSAKLGPCEVCGEYVTEVYHLIEESAYTDDHGANVWTQHGCKSLFGHASCLMAKRR